MRKRGINRSPTLHNKSAAKQAKRYQFADTIYDETAQACICPAGKQLYRYGSHRVINGYAAVKFRGAQRDRLPYSHRDRCSSHPERTKVRQVAFFRGERRAVVWRVPVSQRLLDDF